LTVPGVLHDVCSAVHPLALASPFLRSLPLAQHGLQWRWPEIDLAHPLEQNRAAVMVRSIGETAAGLGPDVQTWLRTFGSLVDDFDDLASEVLGPFVHVPHNLGSLVRFAGRALLPATILAGRFRTEAARALFAGTAAHITTPLDRPATASAGVLLTAAAHSVGWPVAAGGSQAVTAALADLVVELGGTVETGMAITSFGQLPCSRVVCSMSHLRPSSGSPVGVYRAGPAVAWPAGAMAQRRSSSIWPSRVECRGRPSRAVVRARCMWAAPWKRSPPPNLPYTVA
jgi:phytoene dehydrogenase-like protein